MEILMKIHIKNHEEIADLGNRLRQIREELGLSQTELSKALNLNTSVVANVEKYHKLPGSNLLMKLYEVYRVSTNFLLLGEGEMFIGQKDALIKKRLELISRDEECSRVFELMDKSNLFYYAVMTFALKYMVKKDNLIRLDIEYQKQR